ncbi:FecR family protein [Marinibaculum pumilum]|uniref:FecR family protein n=1 Tax=Marinibaculum pumilum TaxID=1766165 RepID=A0ABV7L9E3_9PROT
MTQEREEDPVTAAARDWVLRLASGDLEAAEMAAFRNWVDGAPAHRSAFERERRFWQRLGGLHARSEALLQEAPAAAPPRQRPVPAGTGRRPGRRALLAGGLAAACLALLLLFGGQLRLGLLSDHRTGVGEQALVTLPDGSVAHLNTDSAIAVDFSAGARQIELLQGEAFFEVRPDPARPFRVIAAGGETRAVGTAFVVRRAADGATITVTEGRVAVTSPRDDADPAASVLARAGERTAYAEGAAPAVPVARDPAMAAPWRRGVIVIDDLPLDAALAEIDRYRPGRILLLDGSDRYDRVSGGFDIDRLDAAIAGLAATHGLTVTAIGPYLLVLR